MFDWFKKKRQIKSHSGYMPLKIDADRAKANSRKQIKEGYIQNWVVYRCVELIAQSASDIPVSVFIKDQRSGELKDASKSFAAKVLNAPNECQGRQSFIEAAISSYKITGNAFVMGLPTDEAYMPKGLPASMFVLDPRNIKPTGDKYIPDGFEITKPDGGKKTYPFRDGVSAITHYKNYNPDDPKVGLSPLSPAGAAVDIVNSALNWNASLLENGARPSGFFETEAELSEEEHNILKEQVADKVEGASNAGRTLVLHGGLKFSAASMNMKDMEFTEAQRQAAIGICNSFGVPFQLVVAGESTLNNMKTAQEALYENTVIPAIQGFYDELTRWFNRLDKTNEYVIKLDLDAIPALEEKRRRLREGLESLVSTGIISRDEARVQLGFEEMGGMASSLLIPANLIPSDLGEAPMGEAGANYQFNTKQTDFPENGDDLKVSLRNSNYPQFDRDFAKRIKDNHPEIWNEGGNTRGNEAFGLWGRARAGSDDPEVLDWIEEREAWAARHEENFRIAGVVAQMKWGVIGSRGEKYMKDLINQKIEDSAD